MHYVVLFLVIIFTLPVGSAVGQDGDGGGIPPVDLGDLGDGGGGGGGGGGAIDPVELDLGNLDDTRNQGFVGATTDSVQGTGFIGASSENSGPPLSDGASFGGGVNDSGVQAGDGGGGGGVNGGFGGGGGQGQVGGGPENGFQVIRQGIRSTLVPQINVRPVPGEQIVARFQNRFARQPVPQISGSPVSNQAFSNGNAANVNVQIENRTAVLTGFAGSPAERDRWERQLRLEPGVDRIINQIEVSSNRFSPAR